MFPRRYIAYAIPKPTSVGTHVYSAGTVKDADTVGVSVRVSSSEDKRGASVGLEPPSDLKCQCSTLRQDWPELKNTKEVGTTHMSLEPPRILDGRTLFTYTTYKE